MISRYTIRKRGRTWAQDAGPGDRATGLQLLLNDPEDYDESVSQALRIFNTDRPNVRIVDLTMAASGFRVGLSGPGAVLAGVDAWEDGFSELRNVWHPWTTAYQGPAPLDPNTWRLTTDPAGQILEFLLDRPNVGQVVRLEYTRRHSLTEAPNTVANPSVAPAVALAGIAGNVNDGAHGYAYTWLTAHGETLLSAAATLTVSSSATDGQVQVDVPASNDPGVIGARVYRTAANDLAGTRRLVGALASNGGMFQDDVADVNLGAAAPSANTAGGSNTVRDGDEDLLAMLAGSLMLQMAAIKAAQNTGNTGLPNDIVDRRTQSDVYQARSKSLRAIYDAAIGKGKDADVAPASAIRELDVFSGTRLGFLWHGTLGR